MRRPRGPGGRFLTAAEIAEMEKNKTEGNDSQGQPLEPEDHDGEEERNEEENEAWSAQKCQWDFIQFFVLTE